VRLLQRCWRLGKHHAPEQCLAASLTEWVIGHTHLERTVAEPPNEKNVHAGNATGDLKAKIGKEGARTIPGRPEHGGTS
jgi:hypothetical protein